MEDTTSASTAILHQGFNTFFLIRYKNGAWFMVILVIWIFKFDELNKTYLLLGTVLVVLIIGIVAYLKYLNYFLFGQ
jgi:putative membrane protein